MELEKKMFGINHCEAGLELIRYWKLPSLFGKGVEGHHGPKESNDLTSLADLIKTVVSQFRFYCLCERYSD
jgi:HD-like signal output (HDOD) protein